MHCSLIQIASRSVTITTTIQGKVTSASNWSHTQSHPNHVSITSTLKTNAEILTETSM